MADINAAISKCSLLGFLQSNYQNHVKGKTFKNSVQSVLILPIKFSSRGRQEAGVCRRILASSIKVLPLQKEIQVASSSQRIQKLSYITQRNSE